MDNFWFWAALAWDVLVAWFGTGPWWWQVLALLVMAYAMFCLLAAVVTTTTRVVRWLRSPRLTLVEVQAEREEDATEEVQAQGSAPIIRIEAYLCRMREVPEMPEEGA